MHTKRAAAYCRVSTEKASQLDSYAAQRDFFVLYCQRAGYELVHIYGDEGKSGTRLKGRPQLAQLLRDAESGSFELVLVKDVSRLARNVLDFLSAVRTLRELGTPMLIHQENYSMLNRKIEAGLTDVLTREGVGLMAFGPLAGGRLTGKYQTGIPADSRIGHDPRYLKAEMLTPGLHAAIDALAKIADARGETLSQLALQWALRGKAVTSALIGASRAEQITENVAALSLPPLTGEELAQIDAALALNE